MSQLLDFYCGEATDAEGRFLKDIWSWADDDLEAVHDFIQWLFPARSRASSMPTPRFSLSKTVSFRQACMNHPG